MREIICMAIGAVAVVVYLYIMGNKLSWKKIKS
jgi:hypothetical protein